MRQYTPYALSLVSATAILLALALFAWRRRAAPGALAFALLRLAVAEWSLGYVLELGSADLPSKLWWASVEYLGIVTVPLVWLVFALQYTGHARWLTHRNLVLLAIEPAIMLLLVWTNGAHELVWQRVALGTQSVPGGSFAVLDVIYGDWFWVHATYSYLLLLLGALPLIKMLSSSTRLYREQSSVLLIGVCAPWLGNAFYLAGVSPFPNLDLTPFAFTATGLMFAWDLFRLRLLDLAPVARHAVVESMSDAVIVLDSRSRIVDVNTAAQQVVHQSLSKLIGQPVSSILPEWPDLLESSGAVPDRTAEISLGEGAARCSFELRSSPLYDRRKQPVGHLVVLHDVTERKRVEAAVILKKQWFENLVAVARATTEGPTLEVTLQNALDVTATLTSSDRGSLFLFDTAGAVTHCILARGKTTPDQEHDLVSRVMDVGLAGWVVRHRQPALVEDTLRDERGVVLADAPYIIRSALVVPIVSGPVLLGVLTLHHQLPGHFNLEHMHLIQAAADQMALAVRNAQMYDEQCRLVEQLYQAKELAETANRAKSDFVSFVSHELKTPMTSIRGYAEVLAAGVAGPINPDQANFLSTIRSNVDIMATLVSDLADIARIEAGHLSLEWDAVALAEVIEQVLHTTRRQIELKAQTLTIELPDDLPAIWCDRTRLIQVLTNLISNACKYTPQGGQIAIRAEQTTSGDERALDLVHVAVQDNGIGISLADQAKLFQKFFRSDDTQARGAPGTGLGLNITRNLVELQGGRIWCESTLGEGSTFHFVIPVSAADAPPLWQASLAGTERR
jgi:PAS domain S-box-containing protein